MKNGSAVLIGGFSGGILRAALGLVVVTPIATLLVNLVGAFLLSFWTYWGIERGAFPSWVNLGVGTGLIGAFTTFSTMSTVTVGLLSTNVVLGLAYLLVTAVAGLAMAGLAFGSLRKWGRHNDHDWCGRRAGRLASLAANATMEEDKNRLATGYTVDQPSRFLCPRAFEPVLTGRKWQVLDHRLVGGLYHLFDF